MARRGYQAAAFMFAHSVAEALVASRPSSLSKDTLAALAGPSPMRLKAALKALRPRFIMAFAASLRPHYFPEDAESLANRMAEYTMENKDFLESERRYSKLAKEREKAKRDTLKTEIREHDGALPKDIAWTDDDICVVYDFWRKCGTGSPAETLQLAKELGRRHSSVAFYIGQFEFCEGRGSIWNVQSRAAEIFAAGNAEIFDEVMERVRNHSKDK